MVPVECWWERDMKEDKSNKVVIFIAVGIGCCFILVLLAAILVGGAFLFGVAPVFPTDEVVETTNPSNAQVSQCRQTFAIQESVTIDVERYYFRDGFQDDLLECRIRVAADSVDDVFDLTIVDPTIEGQQQIAPGRYITLTVEEPEPGLFLIHGTWFET